MTKRLGWGARFLGVALILAGCITFSHSSAQTPTPAGSVAVMRFCMVSFVQDIELPAQETGPLKRVHVVEGETITPKKLLAEIDDRQAQLQRTAAMLERDAALARANDDIEVRFAKAAHDEAKNEYERNVAINRVNPGSVAVSELSRLRLAKRRSELQIEKSKLDRKVARMNASVHGATVELTDDKIRRRKLLSPFHGVVMSIKHHQSEWVDAGAPVFRIARMDELKVEGFLDTREFNPHEINKRSVVVTVELARGRKVQFTGRVTMVSTQIIAGNRFRVRAVVKNRREAGQWLLRPGATATTTIELR